MEFINNSLSTIEEGSVDDNHTTEMNAVPVRHARSRHHWSATATIAVTAAPVAIAGEGAFVVDGAMISNCTSLEWNSEDFDFPKAPILIVRNYLLLTSCLHLVKLDILNTNVTGG
jgi:hypothetical protein